MAKKKDKPEEQGLDTGSRKPLEDLGTVKAEAQAKNKAGVKPGTKRGPYNKKKGKAAPDPEPETIENPIDSKVMQQVYTLLFATIARKNGHTHWLLTDQESEALAQATEAVVEKYLPHLGQWMVEINFGVTLIGIVGFKFFQSMQIVEAQRAEQAANDIGSKDEKKTDAK